MAVKSKGSNELLRRKRRVCAWLGCLGFIFGGLGFALNPALGLLFFVILYCPAHAYLIVSQSYFNNRKGTNSYRRFFGRWALMFNAVPLLMMIYLLAMYMNRELILNLGPLTNAAFIGLGFAWFLFYFFLKPSKYGIGFSFYPFEWTDRNEIFTRSEVKLYFANLLVLISLLYTFGVKSFWPLDENLSYKSIITDKILIIFDIFLTITCLAVVSIMVMILLLSKYKPVLLRQILARKKK